VTGDILANFGDPSYVRLDISYGKLLGSKAENGLVVVKALKVVIN